MSFTIDNPISYGPHQLLDHDLLEQDDPETMYTANTRYIKDWTMISSDEDAEDWLDNLLTTLSSLEKRIIFNIYNGLDVRVYMIKLLEHDILNLKHELENWWRVDTKEGKNIDLQPDIPFEDSFEALNVDANQDEVTDSDIKHSNQEVFTDFTYDHLDNMIVDPDLLSKLEINPQIEEFYINNTKPIRNIYSTYSSRKQLLRTIMRPLPRVSISRFGGAFIPSTHDYRLYRLLCYADALHDFKKAHKSSTHQKIKGIAMQTISDTFSDVQIPIGCPAFTKNSKDSEFSKFLNDTKYLVFPDGDEITNPLYQNKVDTECKLSKSVVESTSPHNLDKVLLENWVDQFASTEGYNQEIKTHRSDFWYTSQNEELDYHSQLYLGEHKYKNVMYLSQITELCKNLKNVFGRGKLRFIVDGANDLRLRTILATGHIDIAIDRKYQIYRDTHDGLFSRVKDITTESYKPRERWEYAVCDVNILETFQYNYNNIPDSFHRQFISTYGTIDDRSDSETEAYELPKEHDSSYEGTMTLWKEYIQINPVISLSPTGIVTHIEDKVQASVNGVKLGDDYTLSTSTSINKYIENVNLGDSPFSTTSMKAEINRLIANSEFDDVEKSFVKKRICDWGQVEHCYLYGTPDTKYIFVTGDKLAYLYARFKGICAIHQTVTEFSSATSESDEEVVKYSNVGTSTQSVQSLVDNTGTSRKVMHMGLTMSTSDYSHKVFNLQAPTSC
jgi:hypothetical protein